MNKSEKLISILLGLLLVGWLWRSTNEAKKQAEAAREAAAAAATNEGAAAATAGPAASAAWGAITRPCAASSTMPRRVSCGTARSSICSP